MSNRNLFLLKDIADTQTGPFGTQLHEEDYVDVGTPIVTVEHLGEIGFIQKNLPLVSDEDKERLSKYLLEEGDIVFSRVGSIDKCTYVSKKESGWLFSGRCLRVRINKNTNARYVSFYFRQKYFKEMMLNISVGATMPSLNTALMDNIPIYLPKLDEQNKIADLLSALDSKIALNNRINAELEAMAKTVYDYWFVQFDFPAPSPSGRDGEGSPYKSSGGKMVWCEELKREVPEGWEVKKIGEVATIKAGGDKPVVISSDKTKECPIPIYSNGISNDGLYGYTNKAIINSQSVTISARGTIGFCFLRNKPYVPIIRLISLTPNLKGSAKYFYEALTHFIFENSGSVQQQLTVPQVQNINILYPNEDVLKMFDNITSQMIDRIEIIKEENQHLSSLRDWLLPMLMNGQVSV